MSATASVLRPIRADDYDQVLAWNQDHVELLAPMDATRLTELLAAADTGSVLLHEGRAAGFVLTFAAGAGIEGVNYAWFSQRHDAFLYLDRIVVDAAARRTGLASRAYDEIEARAAELGPVLCLEVNIEPPNEPSLAFHRARGFVEVGRHEANGHLVSLMEKAVRARG